MASTSKQQKRAKRAVTKAKQNRVARVHTRAPFNYDQPPGLSAEDLVAKEMIEGKFEDTFSAMKEAEAIDQQSMFSFFLQNPLLELVAQRDDAQFSIRYMIALLLAYRQWDGADAQEAEAWLSSPETQANFFGVAEEAEAKAMKLHNTQS